MRSLNTRVVFRYVLSVFVLLLLLTSLISTTAHANPSASMALNPSAAGITIGSSVTLTVQIVAGANQIIAAQACVTYDSSKVSAGTPNVSGSALAYSTPSSSADCSAGEVQISQYGLPAFPSGTFTLGTITFTALVSNTTASIGFDSGTSYIKDNATVDGGGNPINIMTGSTGSTLTLNAVPATPPPATPPSNPPSTPSGGTTPTKQPTTPTTPAATPTTPAVADPPATPAAATLPTTTTTPAPQNPDPFPKEPKSKAPFIIGGASVFGIIVIGLVVKFFLLPFLNKRKLDVPTAPIAPIQETSPIDTIIQPSHDFSAPVFAQDPRPKLRPRDL
jgi:hypothetical protein